MLIYKIQDNCLINQTFNTKITFEEFEFLTGKKVYWKKRKNKNIIIDRRNGHVRIFDTEYQLNQFYKNQNQIYVCCAVAQNAYALMSVRENLKLTKFVDPKDSLDWEIV